jgi:hypothetical protein
VIIGRSPERPDLRLSQEEALGYLLGAVVGIELLPQEARGFGSKVEFQAAQEKKAFDKAKEAVKAKKRSARDAAKKSTDAAAALDATLEAIDSAAQEERAARRAQVPPKLVLPDRRAKIVEARESKLKLEPKPEPKPDLEAVAKAAEARAAAAEQAAAITQCDAERAAKSFERLGPCPTLGFLAGFDMPLVTVEREGQKVKEQAPLPESEREWRMAALDRWELSQRLKNELKLVAIEARGEAWDARIEADEARQAADAAVAAEAEAAAAEAAAASERLASTAAALEAAQQRLSELELMQELVATSRSAERAATRERLLRHADKVWGGIEKEAPKVFNFVGMPAENVRAAAGSVSQEATCVEERVALKKWAFRS